MQTPCEQRPSSQPSPQQGASLGLASSMQRPSMHSVLTQSLGSRSGQRLWSHSPLMHSPWSQTQSQPCRGSAAWQSRDEEQSSNSLVVVKTSLLEASSSVVDVSPLVSRSSSVVDEVSLASHSSSAPRARQSMTASMHSRATNIVMSVAPVTTVCCRKRRAIVSKKMRLRRCALFTCRNHF